MLREGAGSWGGTLCTLWTGGSALGMLGAAGMLCCLLCMPGSSALQGSDSCQRHST